MANVRGHGLAGDKLPGAPFIEFDRSQATVRFGLDVRDQHRNSNCRGSVPRWLGPLPAIVDHCETHVSPLHYPVGTIGIADLMQIVTITLPNR